MTPESPSHFGDIQKFSGNFAHSQSLFRSGGKFCKPAHQHRMGQNRHIPQNLQQRVRELRGVLQNWPGRGLEGNTPVGNLHSSNSAWAGVDTASNRAVQGFWRDQAGLHINIKKLLEAVKSLAKKREKVFISVDNTTAFSHLRNWGAEHQLSFAFFDLFEFGVRKITHIHNPY